MNYEIILATNNKHKLQEVREILSPCGIVVYGLSDLQLHPEEVDENGKDYYENALLKANSVKPLTIKTRRFSYEKVPGDHSRSHHAVRCDCSRPGGGRGFPVGQL